jgi:hypothetical protein
MESLVSIPWDKLPLPVVVTLCLIIFIKYSGMWRGEASGQKPDHHPLLAAAVVDPTALNRATDAISKHTQVSEELVDTGKLLARSIDSFATTIAKVGQESEIERQVEQRIRQKLKDKDRSAD